MKRGKSQIVERIAKCGLLSEAEISEVRRMLANESSLSEVGLANRLAEIGWLTPWQSLQLLAGRTSFFVGPYKLLLRLGQGGAAAVYKAQHAAIGHIVALKIFPASLLEMRDAAARFRREAQAAVRVNHPHVVSSYGSKVFGGRGVLIMEFVNGDDLARWLKRCGTLPIDWCGAVAGQAALGLAHIHQRGLVHRDIKPSNIIALGASSREAPLVKIADLGAANIKYGAELGAYTQITAMGALLGTPNYMAPEQIENGHSADHRCDIFGLGCTLFKLLTNELPWTGDTLEQRLSARLKQPPQRLRRFRRDAPPRLEQLIEALLARRPEDRPASAAEVAHELAEFGRAKPEQPAAAVASTEPGQPILRLRNGGAETLIVPPPKLSTDPHLEWRLLRISLQGPPETISLHARDRLILGRGRDCPIRVRDAQVSRRHCQLVWRAGAWHIEDLGSQNGTYVNGVSAAKCKLNSGDQIHIGSTRFWIVAIRNVDAPPPSAAKAPPLPPSAADAG